MVIEINKVKKYFKDRLILDIEHLEIQEYEKIGIVGVNGSGKTTFLNLIAGKIAQDEGQIVVKEKIEYLEQFEKEENSYLSGGEKRKKEILNKFSSRNTILLADEPSSNLDMNAIKLLEKELKKFNGTLLLISHDRNLLDEVCTSIIEISNSKVKKYEGNYTKYMEQKEIELKRKNFEYMQYIQEKERLEKAITVSMNTSKKMKKAPSRMGNSEARLHKREVENKREKLEGHTNALKSRLEKLEEKEKPPKNQTMYAKFNNYDIPKGKKIVSIENLNIKLGTKTIFENANAIILNGTKTAILGDNGTGKTTLIKAILNRNNCIKINPETKIGYFDQEFKIFDFEKTILENVLKNATLPVTDVKNILANLLFTNKDYDKKIKVLSGGEKVKAAIAKLLVSENNLLLLDEPTNFLDVESIEKLEKLLKEYRGTIIFISHDRNFVNNVATNLILIKEHKLEQFEGNYNKYLEHQENKKKTTSNNKILLEFKLAELDSKIIMAKNEEEKKELEAEYLRIKKELKEN